MKGTGKIIITDIGSTTTKAILLTILEKSYEIKGIFHSATTVEKPIEDVKIGVFRAIKGLEKESGISLMKENSTPKKILFQKDTKYLTTSSAGGGLQILVIGLTVFDSASSAKRAAYGAGGVILDTFAINDMRTAVEQMRTMKILHPDIILFSGGVDGGAIGTLIRLGETLSIANPDAKFSKSLIPLVFAGNQDAIPFIKSMFSKQFDLSIVPNLRPELDRENLEPAREKIHQLFMDNVMEQAPGYSQVKNLVSDDIIPTPMGVIKSLQMISDNLQSNIMSVDIGGATTDIFSNINGVYYRTVSANYGMSYSISNVMLDTGFENIRKQLPESVSDDYIRNYISNKMLYPTFNPIDFLQKKIEHIVAAEAIIMSKKHHLEMNFNAHKMGFLDKLKKNIDRDRFLDIMYYDKREKAKQFHFKDIDIMIGAGGVITNVDSPQEAAEIINNGLKPKGITEIWRDKKFISPHLGKLSQIMPEVANDLLHNICFEKLAIVISPKINKKFKADKTIIYLEIYDGNNTENLKIKVNQYYFIAQKNKKIRKIKIVLEKHVLLQSNASEYFVHSDLPIIIDTRISNFLQDSFSDLTNIVTIENTFSNLFTKEKPILNTHLLKVSLPYNGDILVNEGQFVTPKTMIGENRFSPPRLYIVSLFKEHEITLTPEMVQNSLLIKEGDEVKNGQNLLKIETGSTLEKLTGTIKTVCSPVRGRVEKIEIPTGIIILREIQDYSSKPISINIAEKLGIKPKHIKGYLKKRLGEFIYKGETVAARIDQLITRVIRASATGTLIDIDSKKGEITIQYKKKPIQKFANIYGKVKSISEKESVEIEYVGYEFHGIIGFGGEASGNICNYNEELTSGDLKNKIIIIDRKIDFLLLDKLAKAKVNGVIAASIDNKELIKFINEEIGVALTGQEKIPFPFIITEAFGNFKMEKFYNNFFNEHENYHCYLNGHTQIRAGVTRPKIIVIENGEN